jgi:arginyl-tRNA--protein-N-Asp/Glu arginylyltransferase
MKEKTRFGGFLLAAFRRFSDVGLRPFCDHCQDKIQCKLESAVGTKSASRSENDAVALQ